METRPNEARFVRYGIAVSATTLALLVTLLIPGVKESPFFTFFAVAVVVSAWFGGWEAGLLAIVLSNLFAAYFFLTPVGSLAVEREDAIRLIAYDLAAAVLTWLIAAYQSAQRALRGAEANYRRLFDKSPQPMWVYDTQTLRFLAVNDAAVSHYGYSRDEFLKMTILEIRPPEDAPKAWERARESGDKGLLPSSEWRHKTRDGALLNVLIGSHSLTWEGRPARLVLVTDITERKRAEDVMRESEARFRAVAETAPTAIFIHDGAHVLYANPATEQITGYHWPQDANLDFWALVHPDTRAEIQARAQARLRGENPPSRYDFRLVRKDGQERWLDLGTSPINFFGKPAILCVAYDITEGKRAQEALARSEENYRSLVENAPYAVYVSNLTEDRFVTVNPALVRMLGYESKSEVLAISLSRDLYIDPADRQEIIERARRLDEFTGYEVELKRKDGSRITVRVGGRTLRNERGEAEGFEGILEDITERRKLEQQFYQAQKMEAVGAFAGGMAHDFNNLLMVTHSYASMLQEGLPHGDRSRKHAEAIIKAAQRGANLTRQLLAFSRRQVLAFQVLNLNELLAEVCEMLPRLIGEDIELKLVLRPEIGRVKADPNHIEQVVMNLATNARDAMPHGGTLLIETDDVLLDGAYVASHVGSKPGRYVQLTVTDTGTGMDAETRARVFEPFYTTKEVGRGTGLGLASVYGIVKQTGGSIWVDSEPGKGASFTIYLPRVEKEAEEGIPEVQPVVPSAAGSQTVLLVEDEEDVRAATTDYLQMRGYQVLAAANGPRALEIAQRHPGPIHQLVTDVMMPGMTGPELVHRICTIRPEVRVIFTSGYTGDTILSQDVLRSGSVLLQKPFPLEDLVRKLQEVAARERPVGS